MPTTEYFGFFEEIEKVKQCIRRDEVIECSCTSVHEEDYPILALQVGGNTKSG